MYYILESSEGRGYFIACDNPKGATDYFKPTVEEALRYFTKNGINSSHSIAEYLPNVHNYSLACRIYDVFTLDTHPEYFI